MKAISLFSGAGGCALGFEQSGIKVISSYEIDSDACETYKKNINGSCKNLDIRGVDPKDILLEANLEAGELDIIIGGPPCQGFSSAGNKYWSDPRNYLVHKYVEIVKYVLPKWIVFENVEGILTSSNSKHIISISQALISLGYDIKIKKIYAHYLGIPQIRKRVFIVGNRVGIDFDWPEELISTGSGLRDYAGFSNVREAIHDLEYSGSDTAISELDLSRIRLLRPGDTMAKLPPNLQHPSYADRANRRVADGMPTEQRGGAPYGLRRLKDNLPAPTITSGSQRELVHYSQDRFLNIAELKRIQTFPDDFEFIGNRSSVLRQIGNAIPPKLSRMIAEQIIRSMEMNSPLKRKGLISFELTKSGGYSPKLKALKGELEIMTEHQPRLLEDDSIQYPPHVKQKVNKLYTFIKLHKNKILPVRLDDENIKALIGITCRDLGLISPLDHREDFELYNIEPRLLRESLYGRENIVDALSKLLYSNPETEVYLYLLTRIYHKRYKYDLILRHQPLPEPIQVYSRGILEYYNMPERISFLSNLLVWRKWLFDIDNRSAQESGYVFESLLTECLGGESYGAKDSPIKRLDRAGNRQVDCIVESTKTAYEFKMRFTIASSGQGRFSEEKSFAKEARAAGYTPVFLVLDPTESNKLTEITRDYNDAGGKCLTGGAAWDEIKRDAPGHLGGFVEKYIEAPIMSLTNYRKGQKALDRFCVEQIGRDIVFTIGDHSVTIERNEIQELAAEDSES